MRKLFSNKCDLLHWKAKCYKVSNKIDLFCAWRDFNKTFCGISTYHKWMFKLQISSIFNFDQAHQSWISGQLGVNIIKLLLGHFKTLKLYSRAERKSCSTQCVTAWLSEVYKRDSHFQSPIAVVLTAAMSACQVSGEGAVEWTPV